MFVKNRVKTTNVTGGIDSSGIPTKLRTCRPGLSQPTFRYPAQILRWASLFVRSQTIETYCGYFAIASDGIISAMDRFSTTNDFRSTSANVVLPRKSNNI